jgi:hypothetical protein
MLKFDPNLDETKQAYYKFGRNYKFEDPTFTNLHFEKPNIFDLKTVS